MIRLRRRTWVWLVALALVVVVGGWWVQFRHRHCILVVEIALHTYADKHDGRFPSSPKGFGEALLLFLKEGSFDDPMVLVEPGDDGHVYREAIASGKGVDERQCTRIYVQGLKEEQAAGIAIMFDRDSCPGGDHFRSLWGTPVREVIFVRGGVTTVPDTKWPSFARCQIRGLVESGIPLQTARRYYLMTGLKPAQIGEE